MKERKERKEGEEGRKEGRKERKEKCRGGNIIDNINGTDGNVMMNALVYPK